MGDNHDRGEDLRARVARLEAELAQAKCETDAWRKLFAQTTRVLATFASDMDELVQAARSGRPPKQPMSIDVAAEPAKPLN
jgi:hypothetical protein